MSTLFRIGKVVLVLYGGARFKDVARDALALRERLPADLVEFEFNGHVFRVDEHTTVESLLLQFDLTIGGCDIYSYIDWGEAPR